MYSKTILPELKKSAENRFGKEKGELIFNGACGKLKYYLQTADYRNNKKLEHKMKIGLLPALAYYKSLLESGIQKEEALNSVSGEINQYSERASRIFKFTRGLPYLFYMFRFAARNNMKAQQAAGWEGKYVRDDRQEMMYIMTKCPYCGILKEYEAFELLPAFCKADYVYAKGFEPAISFERTETLAEGGRFCDGRFINNRYKNKQTGPGGLM